MSVLGEEEMESFNDLSKSSCAVKCKLPAKLSSMKRVFPGMFIFVNLSVSILL